jgi:hypothetical protein
MSSKIVIKQPGHCHPKVQLGWRDCRIQWTQNCTSDLCIAHVCFMILMPRNFQFDALSRGNQRPNLPYKKVWQDTCGGDSVYISCYQKLCNFATGIFASANRTFSNNNLYFTSIYSEPAVNIISSANKSRRYLHLSVSLCGLEFQFLSFPTHTRLPSRSTLSTFYVLNPPLPLGYNNSGGEDL